ncbi:MAG: hypothetical protein CMP10_08150 [Zetaproteobacteria bacterium]|nr:hypothetical protein [Pseudobdellovibrionaceae bacterium]|tara:strand:- start:359 stop:880 length:522 start_codon:yes stop_codon:yes gene_type:complete
MKNLKSILDLSDNIGKFIEYWGFKSIHGRLWTLIYLAEEPISTPELVKILSVSKGLVSVGINELLEHGLIRKAEKVSGGGQTFVAEDDIGSVVRKVLRDRELKLLMSTQVKINELKSFSPRELEIAGINPERLEQLANLTDTHKNVLQLFVSRGVDSLSQWISAVRSALKSLI